MIRFVWNQPAFQRMLHNPDGGIARDLERRAINVETRAKLYAGAGHPDHPNVDTGRLRSSITHEIRQAPTGLVARVGTNVEYAEYVEKGTDRSKAYPYLEPALEAARD